MKVSWRTFLPCCPSADPPPLTENPAWQALLDRLEQHPVSLSQWNEAATSGLPFTPIGCASSRHWQQSLLNTFGLQHLHETDRECLIKVLTQAWRNAARREPIIEGPVIHLNDLALLDAEAVRILHAFPDTPLTTMLHNIHEAWPSQAWSLKLRTDTLAHQLTEAITFMPSLTQPGVSTSPHWIKFCKKLERFLRLLDDCTPIDPHLPGHVWFNPPLFERLRDHWFIYLKHMNHTEPHATLIDIIRGWDEAAAADAIAPFTQYRQGTQATFDSNNVGPYDDIVSCFCALARSDDISRH